MNRTTNTQLQITQIASGNQGDQLRGRQFVASARYLLSAPRVATRRHCAHGHLALGFHAYGPTDSPRDSKSDLGSEKLLTNAITPSMVSWRMLPVGMPVVQAQAVVG